MSQARVVRKGDQVGALGDAVARLAGLRAEAADQDQTIEVSRQAVEEESEGALGVELSGNVVVGVRGVDAEPDRRSLLRRSGRPNRATVHG